MSQGLHSNLNKVNFHTVYIQRFNLPQVLYLLNEAWLGLLQIHLILQTEKKKGIHFKILDFNNLASNYGSHSTLSMCL